MKKYTLEELKAGSKFVPIEEICMNDWNPKVKRSDEYYKVKDSININGQLMPLVVRNAKGKDYKYEILDGEQRYTAMQDLGFTEVWIVNLGDVPDSEAKASTVWLEQAVPFDDNLLGELLIDLKGEVELPYTDEEIDLIAGVFPDEEEEEEEDELNFSEDFGRFGLVIYKTDKDEIKDIHQTIIDKYINVPEGIDTAMINWSLLKLATMDEVKDLLMEIINTKKQLTTEEEPDEGDDTPSNS